MDSSYPDVSSLWDLSHNTAFPQLPDDDFMAMLQKQFPLPPPNNPHTAFPHAGVNPQNISKLSLPSLSPPSEDSSPSPPHNPDFSYDLNEDSPTAGDGGSRSGSAGPRESNLKRKASFGGDNSSNGPSQKSQHTLSNDKKGATSSSAGSRRKSIGGATQKDETRLMKRKEQNRAAQRAFRERKEKHVKDLEDKVAELEAKNDAAQHENENLRDLLSRLQSENVMLKQSNFTFTMSPPKSQSDPPPAPRHFSPEASIYTTSSPTASSMVSPDSSRAATKPTNLLDWTSLTSFDPNILSLLEETPQSQPTATSSAMDLDLFSTLDEGPDSSSPFTTIASNPVFMSFASSFDTMTLPENSSAPMNKSGNRSNSQSFNFDMNSLGSWPTPTPPAQDTSLDDLFAGYVPNQTVDFSTFATTPSISPVTHQATVNNPAFTNVNGKNYSYLTRQSSDAARLSSIPSPTSQSTVGSDPSPKEGDHSPHVSNSATDAGYHKKSECPKTKSELLKRINEAGSSPFARAGLSKALDQHGSMVSCAGTNLPKTAKNDMNVEVLSAWRSITSNPAFKDANIDINDLCAQFTDKAKCDGTKVVLEPQGMHDIIESLASKNH
ncbi:transcriptional regulator family: bZIP [Agaricus bisporus var. burnettii]|uniref:Transcriptional regulator family: bZIP n=1 Tax=Agaricus bisporus var. burnettii TaxID=192524 RepID=A0A8H7FBV6_AGABI|nr:transcriptional regulator family: bZIP [Agaricus bisporus var. burnettii]